MYVYGHSLYEYMLCMYVCTYTLHVVTVMYVCIMYI